MSNYVAPVALRPRPQLLAVASRHDALPARRIALLARIHIAREETAEAGRRVAADLHATARTRHAIYNGWKLAKAAAVAAGVLWSFNAASNIGRGRRFVTIAISLLSTARALRKARAFLIQPEQST